MEKWRDIFDLKVAGICCAFSVKVKGGKLVSEDVYALPGVDPSTLTPSKKVCILTKYSIYIPARANWTKDAMAAFEATKIKLQANEEVKVDKYKIISKYDAKKKSIEFLGKKHQVSGALINEFIYLVPKMWNNKQHWGIMLLHVKCAATLINDFDPAYFLHNWSTRNHDLHNKAGNNDQYARRQINPEMAGESLTWLQNMAQVGWQPDPNLGCRDMGFAENFATKRGKFIKIVSDDGTYGMIQTTSGCTINNKWIGNKISNVLEKEFKAEMKKFNGIKLINIAKKLKMTNKDMKCVLSYHRAMDIVHKVSPMLEDMDFLTKMNLQSI
jgi:hypothetical protein